MSARQTRANQAVPSAAGRPSAPAVAGTIPTSHEPLDVSTVDELLDVFSAWLAADLARLETRFAAFTTRSSLKTALKR